MGNTSLGIEFHVHILNHLEMCLNNIKNVLCVLVSKAIVGRMVFVCDEYI